MFTMGRPNFSTSQWFSQLSHHESWLNDAECSDHPELPWTDEKKPDDYAQNAMRNVCLECPVRAQCARSALTANNGAGVDGGFYAGIWIPWRSHGHALDMPPSYRRRTARAALKHVAIGKTR